MTYRIENVLAPTAGATTFSMVAATANQVASKEFRMGPEDSLYFRCTLSFASIVATTAISMRLQHTYDGTNWVDAGTESQVSVVFAAFTNASITTGTENINATGHGFVTGDKVYFTAATTAPTGLTTGTHYYVIKVDADNFKLASTYALAFAGTAIDITNAGSGNMKIASSTLSFLLNNGVSADAAQLPTWPLCRVVLNASTTDSASVDGIYITRRF